MADAELGVNRFATRLSAPLLLKPLLCQGWKLQLAIGYNVLLIKTEKEMRI